MPRPRTIKTLKKSCDQLWSKIIRARDSQCVRCGKPSTEAHHIHGRRNHSVRWDLDNGLGLCAACHKWDRLSFEQAPNHAMNQDIIVKKLGANKKEELDMRAVGIVKRKMEDYLELEQYLKDMLATY